jgi:alkylation response protein AidB-like acyl-CoA dehydrogenase/cytochrome b involved in lipid metabolism
MKIRIENCDWLSINGFDWLTWVSIFGCCFRLVKIEMATFTYEEVALHNKKDDIWIVVHDKVYDVTRFLNLHPGGAKQLLGVAGKDATVEFLQAHRPEIINKYPKLCIGTIQSPKHTKTQEMILYSDPNWYQGFHSPYYNDSHIRFRTALRNFVDLEISPFVNEWSEAMKIPDDLRKKAYQSGFLAGVIGGKWPTEYVGSKILGDVPPEEWDAFHELILFDELSRCGSGGLCWGMVGGVLWGFIRPLMTFGSEYQKDLIIKPVLTGEKAICLCISEPYAGSDVAGLKATAHKTEDGEYYLVSGEKKWITNGTFADFFIVGARTGGPGMGGLSVFILEKGMPGISVKPMKTTGMWGSGTSFITFENVKVPKKNLVGKEGEGFKLITWNFNHERWSFLPMCIRFSRVCYEEAFRYASKRKAFGGKLIENPVIRAKLGNMLRGIETSQSYLEQLTYQITKMSHEEKNIRLGGPIAMFKTHCTLLLESCAREGSQIFGGLGYSRNSQGEKVERLFRDCHAFALGGGSEEVLLDFSVKQSIKMSKL